MAFITPANRLRSGQAIIQGAGEVGSPPAAGTKWHPGHYMGLLRGDLNTVSPDHTTAQGVRFASYNTIANEPDVVGAAPRFFWSMLEGATRGDYSAGRTLIQNEINHLKNLSPYPKRLYLFIRTAHFVGSANIPNPFYPTYMHNAGYTWVTPQGGINYKVWNSTAAGYFIDMVNSYADILDDEPFFEGICINTETAWGGGTRPPDFDAKAAWVQLRRMISEIKPNYPKTNIHIGINWNWSVDDGTGQAEIGNTIEHARVNGCGMGGPDILPDWLTNFSNEIDAYHELLGDSESFLNTDFRGQMPVHYRIEGSELGGVLGDFTPQQINDFANSTLRPSHRFWDNQEYQGTSEQRWSTGVLPFIRANPIPAAQQVCPANYTSCDIS